MKRAITERMDVIESNMQDLFTNLYCKEDFLHLLQSAKKAKADRRPFLLSKLARMLNDVGEVCAYGKTVSYYEEAVKKLCIPDNTEKLNKKLVDALNEVYVSYPHPGEFMQRIVDLLDPGISGTDSLALRILKRFMVTVNVRENKKYYSRTLAKADVSNVDESAFDVLSNNADKKCDSVPLVQAAFHLANGNFVSPVTTKELLFLFAFAYDMRYYSSADANDYALERDVEKNLFGDYYCDNLTRYLYSEDGGKSGNCDKEPSGFGLNPKNFVDVAFVYYLNAEDMTAPQKVSGFYTMINKVKDIWKNQHEYAEARKGLYESVPSDTYRTRLAAVLGGMDEDTFEQYLLEHYYCDVRYTYVNRKTGELQQGSKGPFELQFAVNSAYDQYTVILDLIREVLDLAEADFGAIDFRVLRDTAEGKTLDDLYTKEDGKVANRLYELQQNVPNTGLACFCELEEGFMRIIRNIEKRLNPYEAISVTDATGVTRTKLISAYYHYYCLENGMDDGRGAWISFRDVYEDMSSCLNPYLEDAGYSKISSKSLYDVFVIFFAYCKINNLLS